VGHGVRVIGPRRCIRGVLDRVESCDAIEDREVFLAGDGTSRVGVVTVRGLHDLRAEGAEIVEKAVAHDGHGSEVLLESESFLSRGTTRLIDLACRAFRHCLGLGTCAVTDVVRLLLGEPQDFGKTP
jgi:hypothetical protein